MKKHVVYFLLSTLIVAFSVISSKGQAYYDAIDFAKIYKGSGQIDASDTLAAKILKNYFGSNIVTNTNPFLEPYFIDGGTQALGTKYANKLRPNRQKESLHGLNGLAGLDVTTIAEGMAMFMIGRAKEELTVTFFERFRKFSDENPEFKALFPKTTTTLDRLLSYYYTEMLSALRVAFYEDLKSIPLHFDDVLALDKYRYALDDFPELRFAITSLHFFIQKIEIEKLNPAQIISEYSELPEWKEAEVSIGFKNMGASLKLMNLLSKNLISTDGDSTWVSPRDVRALVSDKVAFDIFVGLIYQQANLKKEETRFYLPSGGQKYFSDILKEQKDNLVVFQNFLTEFIETGEKIQEISRILAQERDAGKEVSKDVFYEYFSASISIIESGFDLYKIFDPSLELSGYIKIARKSNELFRSIYKEQYATMVVNLTEIFNELAIIVDERKKDKISILKGSLVVTQNATHSKEVHRFFKDVQSNEIVDKKLSSKRIALLEREIVKSNSTTFTPDQKKKVAFILSIKRFEKIEKVMGKVTKYGLFMANMANAQSPEEVKDILESVVLPVGSSSIKKNSRFNISIQSYLGAYYLPNTNADNPTTAWNDPFGVHAPIGVSFSKGFGHWGALGVFTSLLDIGAIVDYQLKSETVVDNAGNPTTAIKKDYSIELGQIFSPGGYLVYGLPCKLPLALGAGAQYGPGLSKVDSSGMPVLNSSKWRFNMFLSVDIPLFTLVNSRKNYRSK